jgi:hypothetical protein
MPENPLEAVAGTISEVHYQIVKDLEDIKLSMANAVSRGM